MAAGTATRPSSVRPNPAAAFLGMAAILLAKVLIGHWLALGSAPGVGALISDSVLVLALLGLVELLFWRWRFVAYVTLDVVVSLLLIALTEYVQFYESMPTPGMFRVVGQLGSVAPSILSILGPVYLLYLLDLPFLIVFRRRAKAIAAQRRPRGRRMSIAIAAALVLGVAAIAWAWVVPSDFGDIAEAGSRGVIAFESAAMGKAVTGWGSAGSAEVLGASSKAAARDVDYTSAYSVQVAIDDLSRRGRGERIARFSRGQYAGANVIAIQVESLQRFAIDSFVMPNLDALTNESWFFPNGFSSSGTRNHLRRRVRHEHVAVPAPGRARVRRLRRPRSSRRFRACLREQGYLSFTMHANTARYWNRTELYPALGFEDYYDRSYFGTDHTIGMGASDRQLVKKALPIVVSEAIAGTDLLPAHHPLAASSVQHAAGHDRAADARRARRDHCGPLPRGDELRGPADRLVHRASSRQNGLWDKSIVVIYGDHAGLRASDLSKDDNHGAAPGAPRTPLHPGRPSQHPDHHPPAQAERAACTAPRPPAKWTSCRRSPTPSGSISRARRTSAARCSRTPGRCW